MLSENLILSLKNFGNDYYFIRCMWCLYAHCTAQTMIKLRVYATMLCCNICQPKSFHAVTHTDFRVSCKTCFS